LLFRHEYGNMVSWLAHGFGQQSYSSQGLVNTWMGGCL